MDDKPRRKTKAKDCWKETTRETTNRTERKRGKEKEHMAHARVYGIERWKRVNERASERGEEGVAERTASP